MLVVVGLILLAALLVYAVPKIVQLVRGDFWPRTASSSGKSNTRSSNSKQARTSPLDALAYIPTAKETKPSAHPADVTARKLPSGVVTYRLDTTPPGHGQRTQAPRESLTLSGKDGEPTKTASAKAEPADARPAAKRASITLPARSDEPAATRLLNDLDQLMNKVRMLEMEMARQSIKASETQKQMQAELGELKKQADDDLKRLIMVVAEEVGKVSGRMRVKLEDMLRASQQGLLAEVQGLIDRRVGEAVRPVEELMTEQTYSLLRRLDETAKRVSQVDEEGEKVKGHLIEVLMELSKSNGLLQERLKDSPASPDWRAAQDSFYAKTLGAVLGQSVEALQDGNFERLMGERLDDFFRTGVGRGEGLQQLHSRAQAIIAALRQVIAQMAKSGAETVAETHPHLQRFESLCEELNRLQAQLQSRQGVLKTMISVPVSLHAGARQGFLDELGRGVKREIDKLAEPDGYFTTDLDRLIGIDLLAVVDICDKKVAPPGTSPETEAALKQLFEQASLRQILPRQGEPFKTAEQELIEVSRGGGGPSLTVARVITRGFYYKNHGKEALLRKAGVAVRW